MTGEVTHIFPGFPGTVGTLSKVLKFANVPDFRELSG